MVRRGVPSRGCRKRRSARGVAVVLAFLAATPVLVTGSESVPRPDIRRYDLLTQEDLGTGWVRIDQARVPVTEEPDVPEALNTPCYRNQRIRLAFRQRVEESVQLQAFSAALPASSAVFQPHEGGYIYEISVRAARLPAEDIDRLERSLTESSRTCDNQAVPSSNEDPYGRTINENLPAAPTSGDHSVALRRTITSGGSADWPTAGESLYLIREGEYVALLVFKDLDASLAYTQESLVHHVLTRSADRLHLLNS